MIDYVWLVPAFPLIGVLLNGLAGIRFPKILTGFIGSLMILLSFVVSCLIMAQVLQTDPGARVFEVLLYRWIPCGDLEVNIGFLVDALSLIMMLTVSGVSFVIHVYSVGYMHDLSALAMLAMAAGLAGCDAAMGPLHQAAMTGDAEVVKSWIAQKRNVDVTFDEPSRCLEGNYARAQGMTALMLAARTGQFEIVKLLAEGGANLYAESNWRDGSNPRNAFDYAAEHAVDRGGRLEAVEYLWRRSDGVRYAARLEEHVAASCRLTCNDKYGGDARSYLALFLIGIAPDRQRGTGISEAACYSQRPLELLALTSCFLSGKVFLPKH